MNKKINDPALVFLLYLFITTFLFISPLLSFPPITTGQ